MTSRDAPVVATIHADPNRNWTMPHARPRRLSMLVLSAFLALTSTRTPEAQPAEAGGRPILSPAVRRFVHIDTTVVALTHARVIDGTGAAPRENQTLLIRDGRISAMGSDGRVPVPDGAQVLDLAGKTVIPGLVMVHEHLYYPTGPGVYAYLAESFPRLYLAGGVTAMRTGGNMNGYGELGVAKAIARGEKAGPWIDATAPYLQGPGLGLSQLHAVSTPDEARRMVDSWAEAGATSFKAYMHISRATLGAAIEAAHARGLKVTGHLCSVTYAEAARLGIDNLEHGFFSATDFVTDKKPDECPQTDIVALTAALDTARPALRALIAELVRRNVAVTSTLTIFETFVPGRPMPRGLDVLVPALREQYERQHSALAGRQVPFSGVYPAMGAAELAFARAGGLLLVGTDPTGSGGVVPGYANQRALELLVEAGFTPLEAISIGTLNGAKYLGRAGEIGSIAIGKQADLVVVGGDPSVRIEDVRNVELVFKQGVGFDPQKLIDSVRGRVGLF
ncbi:MAG TPA: amidohydrolase family protein [Gemmatimonadaceae bacterium]|nr:amidohydrolase family protein [Gemmatimonadaceae bacterium]